MAYTLLCCCLFFCLLLVLEEVVNAVRSQNQMTLCPFLLWTVENTAVYTILYLFTYI